MKAIVQETYGSPHVLEIRDIDRPTIADDEVLLRVHAAGVDQGVWHLITGRPYLLRVLGYGLTAPRSRVPGTDVAGSIVAVGAGVTRFQVGDEVYGTCDGAFAEYAKAREESLVAKPAGLTFEQAAAVPTSAVAALQAVRNRVHLDMKVLVTGAGGGVGTFAVQLAKAFGGVVTGVCSTRKMETVRRAGADHLIDYTRHDFARTGLRYHLIVDAAGNRSLSDLRGALTPEGTLVIVGGEAGDRWIGGLDRQLRTLVLSPFVRQSLRPLFSSPTRASLEFLTTLVEAGQVTPVVDRTFTLGEAPEALRYLEAGQARGKVVIVVQAGDAQAAAS